LAAQAGSISYNAAASVSRSFIVVKANQTIAFAALANQTYGVAPFTVNATASSALPVAFASLTLVTCTVSGGTVMLTAQGTCTIRATQAGDASFAAAALCATTRVGDDAYFKYNFDAHLGAVQRSADAAAPSIEHNVSVSMRAFCHLDRFGRACARCRKFLHSYRRRQFAVCPDRNLLNSPLGPEWERQLERVFRVQAGTLAGLS
jgi:hypothetical protein